MKAQIRQPWISDKQKSILSLLLDKRIISDLKRFNSLWIGLRVSQPLNSVGFLCSRSSAPVKPNRWAFLGKKCSRFIPDGNIDFVSIHVFVRFSKTLWYPHLLIKYWIHAAVAPSFQVQIILFRGFIINIIGKSNVSTYSPVIRYCLSVKIVKTLDTLWCSEIKKKNNFLPANFHFRLNVTEMFACVSRMCAVYATISWPVSVCWKLSR